MLEFVTVTFARERWLQKLQARSFATFMPTDLVKAIHLIVNEVEETATTELQQFVNQQVIPEYGCHANNVVVHLVKNIMTDGITLQGYDRQQVLKMRCVAGLRSDGVIVLDSKNIIIRALSSGDFYSNAGMLKASFEDMRAHMFWNLVPRYDRLMGGDGQPKDSVFLATMTPFAMIPNYCVQLINHVESVSGQNFERQFEHQSAYKSEFLMYGIFLKNRIAPLESIYARADSLSWTVWPKHYPGAAVLRGGLEKAHAANKGMIGLHLRRVEAMTDDEIRAVSSFLSSVGLWHAGETVRLL